jgi:hypothetical protein
MFSGASNVQRILSLRGLRGQTEVDTHCIAYLLTTKRKNHTSAKISKICEHNMNKLLFFYAWLSVCFLSTLYPTQNKRHTCRRVFTQIACELYR